MILFIPSKISRLHDALESIHSNVARYCFGGPAIWYTYTQSTPHARLAWALGVDIPSDTTISRLRQTDSFNDGSTVWGACDASPPFVGLVVKRHSLAPGLTGGYLLTLMPDAPIPEDGLGYRGDRLTVYYDDESSLVYFVRRFSEPRP